MVTFSLLPLRLRSLGEASCHDRKQAVLAETYIVEARGLLLSVSQELPGRGASLYYRPRQAPREPSSKVLDDP